MNIIKIETFIQKYFDEAPRENEYVSIYSPEAVENAKLQLEYESYSYLPGLIKMTINDEIILGQTSSLFWTWDCFTDVLRTKMNDTNYSITLLDNSHHIKIEKQDDHALIIDESQNRKYENKRLKPPFITINLLLDEIERGVKDFIKFCQDAKLTIKEDCIYYDTLAFIERL